MNRKKARKTAKERRYHPLLVMVNDFEIGVGKKKVSQSKSSIQSTRTVFGNKVFKSTCKGIGSNLLSILHLLK
jgi:hypothetical protein